MVAIPITVDRKKQLLFVNTLSARSTQINQRIKHMLPCSLLRMCNQPSKTCRIYGCCVQLISTFSQILLHVLHQFHIAQISQVIMDKLLLCALCLGVVSKCVYAQPFQNCATTLCAAVMCFYGREPFRPPGQCCLKCRPAKPKEGM